jgi:hypothetical protein
VSVVECVCSYSFNIVFVDITEDMYYAAIFVQGGAEETHVFHIRITLFIFNIKKF